MHVKHIINPHYFTNKLLTKLQSNTTIFKELCLIYLLCMSTLIHVIVTVLTEIRNIYVTCQMSSCAICVRYVCTNVYNKRWIIIMICYRQLNRVAETIDHCKFSPIQTNTIYIFDSFVI